LIAEAKLQQIKQQQQASGGSVDVGQLKAVKQIIEEAEKKLDLVPGVTKTHGAFYRISAQYLQESGDFGGYYREALRYLGCVELRLLTESERHHQALCLSLAALLGDDVYNFGELLVHPVLESLDREPNFAWLPQLLRAFNAGDLSKFEEMSPKWQGIPDLHKHQEQLAKKIRLLCLMEMAYLRQGDKRQLKFAEIAKQAKVPANEVEYLVMRALSLGLIRGFVDQVDSLVCVEWVQPRVLDRKQISAVSGRIGKWSKDVAQMHLIIDREAEEILTQ